MKNNTLDVVDNHDTILRSMKLGCMMAYTHESKQRVWGGDKCFETQRDRKDFENDIARPLGADYFRRAYRMKKESFYKLFSILQSNLKRQLSK